MVIETTGIYPGSFNPWHDGHTDILDKALMIFDHVVVARGVNTQKALCMSGLTTDDVVRMRDVGRITLTSYEGLLVDEITRLNERGTPISAVVRGLRNGYDLQYEQNLQYWNEDLGLDIPTVYFICDRALGHISSSAIRGVKNMKKEE